MRDQNIADKTTVAIVRALFTKLVEAQKLEKGKEAAARRLVLTAAMMVFRKNRYLPRIVLDARSLKALHGGDLAVSDSAVDVFVHALRKTFRSAALNSVSGNGYEFSMQTEQDRRKRGKGKIEIDFALTSGGQTPYLLAGPNEHTLLDVVPYERVVATVRKREAIEKGKKAVRTTITTHAGRVFIAVIAAACVTRLVIHVLAGEPVGMDWDGMMFHADGKTRSGITIHATLEDGRQVLHSLESTGDGRVQMTVDVSGARDTYRDSKLWRKRDGLIVGVDFGATGKWVRPNVFVPDGTPDGQFYVLICGERFNLCDEVRSVDVPAGSGTIGWRFHSVELPSTFTCKRDAERVWEFFAVRDGKETIISRITGWR